MKYYVKVTPSEIGYLNHNTTDDEVELDDNDKFDTWETEFSTNKAIKYLRRLLKDPRYDDIDITKVRFVAVDDHEELPF